MICEELAMFEHQAVWFGLSVVHHAEIKRALTKRLPMSLGRVLFPSNFVVSPLSSRFSTISNLDKPSQHFSQRAEK